MGLFPRNLNEYVASLGIPVGHCQRLIATIRSMGAIQTPELRGKPRLHP